jgi:ribosomal protein L33
MVLKSKERGTMRNPERITLECETCGTQFERLACQIKKEGTGRFCSQECMWEWRRHGSTLACDMCGDNFYRRYGEQDSGAVHAFCSRECTFAWRAKHSKTDTYRKIGARHAHRVIAERMVRRKLKPGEVVHHKNGDHRDNRPENLAILPSQAEHARIHFSKNR